MYFTPKLRKHPDLHPIFPDDLTETSSEAKTIHDAIFRRSFPLYRRTWSSNVRARHLPFEITPERAKAWLSCMYQAMDEVGLEGDIRDFYYHRLFLTAQHMVNTASTDGKGEDS